MLGEQVEGQVEDPPASVATVRAPSSGGVDVGRGPPDAVDGSSFLWLWVIRFPKSGSSIVSKSYLTAGKYRLTMGTTEAIYRPDGKETSGMGANVMIEAEGLQKRYGETRALAGVDFSVPAGTILGLLGPNGAGKTTAVRILTTLARPDAGRGAVAGIDVVKHPGEVRRYIGVAAQDATLDPLLTGRQNLVLVGELSTWGVLPPGVVPRSCWASSS